MELEWDPRKAAENRRKHGVSFDEASSGFGDPLSRTAYDPDHSADEDRCITVGLSNKARLLLVAHTNRGVRIRIISARQLTRAEQHAYEEENQA